MKKKIVILSDVSLKYQYPHPFDLGEIIGRSGREIDIIFPYDLEVKQWNQGRRLQMIGVLPSGRLGLLYSMYRAIPSNSAIVATSPKTLIIASISKLLKNCSVIYYVFELSVYGDKNSRSAFLQHLLRVISIPVFLTGKHRARIFKKIYKPRGTVQHVECSALMKTGTKVNNTTKTLESRIIEETGARPRVILVVNGGISSNNQFDKILSAKFCLSDNVAVAIFGQVSESWRIALEEARRAGYSYYYFGEMQGTRYDLIRLMQGCDLGWAVKSNRKVDSLNDRTYTPNKFFDYAAAGLITIVGSHRSLDEYVKEGLAKRLPDETPEGVRHLVMTFAQVSAIERERMHEAVNKRYKERWNYEESSKQLTQLLLGL